jgi:hypothetical protein
LVTVVLVNAGIDVNVEAAAFHRPGEHFLGSLRAEQAKFAE